MPDISDDDQLLAVLKESLQAQWQVPADFTEAGRSAYAWRNIDAELAELTYDSTTQDHALSPGVGPRPHRSARSPSPRTTCPSR